MLEKVTEVLQSLHTKEVMCTKAMRSEFEKTVSKITNGLRWLGGALFVLLCGVALVAKSSQPINGLWIAVAQILAIAQMGAAVLWLVLDTIPPFISMLLYKTYSYRIRQLELAHDMERAAELHQFDVKTLKLTDKLISIQIERMKARMVFFFGGSDKIAVFALAGMGWAVWKNLPVNNQSWEHEVYMYSLAFLGGLAIGGMFVNAVIKKLSYQRDLLSIAISQLEEE